MDFTITVSNSLRAFGMEQASRWNEFNWGTGFWGFGYNDTTVAVGKALGSSLTLTDTTSLSVGFIRNISESLFVTGDLLEQTLKDGAGYNYVFTRPTIDGENRNLTEFSEVAPASTTWTEDSPPTTDWSEE